MKTWLITGCSTGFGRRFALAAGHRGHQVVATARDVRADRLDRHGLRSALSSLRAPFHDLNL